MRCYNCNKKFDYEKYYGICPKCGCFNRQETAEEQQARRLELRMNQYPADKLRHMAADPALTEEERAAAARVLSRRS